MRNKYNLAHILIRKYQLIASVSVFTQRICNKLSSFLKNLNYIGAPSFLEFEEELRSSNFIIGGFYF